ncbi:MAG: OmpA family protein [Betaproteobacteria bacterium]|nr:OmpA family protein [Betaproteobacteria bacterium]MDH5222855.1 OmpA family protein [Betaproteobacteria bacterium]MDH5352547.1 OmpA family protein [Betaproteobacteria bacterium]
MSRYLATMLAFSLAAAGCATDRPLTYAESGALIGLASGAVIGAAAYKKNRTKGAVVGAVGGGLAGAAVGTYMDNQKRDLEKNLAAEIQAGQARVQKISDQVVLVTMTSQTAFDTDSSSIKPAFHSTLNKLADVVVRYGKTTLTVVGHTDNVGSNEYNQKLSERRALAVAQYLESQRVNGMRLATAGRGELDPVQPNATAAGRQANRRVEIYVEAVVQG